MALALRVPKAKPKLPVLTKSKLEVFDIPLDLLVESAENPQEMDEATFDQLVQGVREEGIDEPIQVIPIVEGSLLGKFRIVGGHHRSKAAKVAGLKEIPAILKPGWTEDKRKIELVRRNLLRGETNPAKFTHLFTQLIKAGHDKSVLRQQMGIIKDDVFKRMFKQVEGSLTPVQKKKLVEAKERINSVESFSSVLNEIFRNHGSELDHGLLCFKYGEGKKQSVWYVTVDTQLDKQLKKLQEEIQDRGLHAEDVFKKALANLDLNSIAKSSKVTDKLEAKAKKP